MKRSLLARLRTNGALYLLSALLLIVGIPLYQALILGPNGFATALSGTGTGRFAAYLAWIHGHNILFIIYRILLTITFALILTLPLSLYRIIVAQEILGMQERAEAERAAAQEQAEQESGRMPAEEPAAAEEAENGVMPAYAWRGKGFAVLAVWAGLFGIAIYVLATVISTVYFVITSNGVTSGGNVPDALPGLASLFSILTNTIGIGLLGLSALFFGAMITRTGRNLWPGIWTTFGYVALFVGALLCISAVGVVTAPGSEQGVLTTVATLLFALWVLWLGIMLVRLKAEA